MLYLITVAQIDPYENDWVFYDGDEIRASAFIVNEPYYSFYVNEHVETNDFIYFNSKDYVRLS